MTLPQGFSVLNLSGQQKEEQPFQSKSWRQSIEKRRPHFNREGDQIREVGLPHSRRQCRNTSHGPAEALQRPGAGLPPGPKARQPQRASLRHLRSFSSPPTLRRPFPGAPPLPLMLSTDWIMTCAGALFFRCRLVGMCVNQQLQPHSFGLFLPVVASPV